MGLINTWMIPLITRRSSTRGTPRVSHASSGDSRANCASLSHKDVSVMAQSWRSPLGRLNLSTRQKGIYFMGPEPRAQDRPGLRRGSARPGLSGARRAVLVMSGRGASGRDVLGRQRTRWNPQAVSQSLTQKSLGSFAGAASRAPKDSDVLETPGFGAHSRQWIMAKSCNAPAPRTF